MMLEMMILKKIHFVTIQKSPALKGKPAPAAFAITLQKRPLARILT
jgi:hypothetical protein